MKKKRAITLLEIMIVIFLIGLIRSVIGYNMKGSMDKGRAFKSEQGIERLTEILELTMAEHGMQVASFDDAEKCLGESQLAKDPNKLLKDGWGVPYTIQYEDGKLKITSEKLDAYREKQKK